MEFEFDKMHGCGNDFMVIDRLASPASPVPPPAVIARLADRRCGVGFDQLLIVEPWDDTGRQAQSADSAEENFGDRVASYRIFNADGSVAEQCGNGARCIARLLAERHGTGHEFVMQAPKGPVAVRLTDAGVAVSMGPPDLAPGTFPVGATPTGSGRFLIDLPEEMVTISPVAMGNPHAVVVVDDAATAPVERLATQLQGHRAFPDGVNVGFLQPVSRQRGALRVVERGAGETPACGSGACAAAVAGMSLGLFDDTVALDLRGGKLVVSWHGSKQDVWLQGPTAWVYKGQLTL